METREMICINCPLGCSLTCKVDGENIEVSGNTCPRGTVYAKDEILHPTRMITSTIPVLNGERVSCKTQRAVDKDKIFDVMKEIQKAKCMSPIRIGDVLIQNVCNTGIDIVATKNIN